MITLIRVEGNEVIPVLAMAHRVMGLGSGTRSDYQVEQRQRLQLRIMQVLLARGLIIRCDGPQARQTGAGLQEMKRQVSR
jgi:hypothetical protein